MLRTCTTCAHAKWNSQGLDPYFQKHYNLGECNYPLPLTLKSSTIFRYKVRGRWCSQGNGDQVECPTHSTLRAPLNLAIKRFKDLLAPNIPVTRREHDEALIALMCAFINSIKDVE